MGNVSGKAYGLTVLTRSHHFKTFFLKGTFAAIMVSLKGFVTPVNARVVESWLGFVNKFRAIGRVWRPVARTAPSGRRLAVAMASVVA